MLAQLTITHDAGTEFESVTTREYTDIAKLDAYTAWLDTLSDRTYACSTRCSMRDCQFLATRAVTVAFKTMIFCEPCATETENMQTRVWAEGRKRSADSAARHIAGHVALGMQR